MDVRVIAATHRNLEEMIQEGTFRQDLYYRLNVIRSTCRRCATARADIPTLARHFLKRYNDETGKNVKDHQGGPRPAATLQLSGNIRELQNCIERA